jgi:hypothetical protein
MEVLKSILFNAGGSGITNSVIIYVFCIFSVFVLFAVVGKLYHSASMPPSKLEGILPRVNKLNSNLDLVSFFIFITGLLLVTILFNVLADINSFGISDVTFFIPLVVLGLYSGEITGIVSSLFTGITFLLIPGYFLHCYELKSPAGCIVVALAIGAFFLGRTQTLKKNKIQTQGLLWLANAFLEMNKWDELASVVDKIRNRKNTNQSQIAWFEANLEVYKGQKDKAIQILSNLPVSTKFDELLLKLYAEANDFPKLEKRIQKHNMNDAGNLLKSLSLQIESQDDSHTKIDRILLSIWAKNSAWQKISEYLKEIDNNKAIDLIKKLPAGPERNDLLISLLYKAQNYDQILESLDSYKNVSEVESKLCEFLPDELQRDRLIIAFLAKHGEYGRVRALIVKLPYKDIISLLKKLPENENREILLAELWIDNSDFEAIVEHFRTLPPGYGLQVLEKVKAGENRSSAFNSSPKLLLLLGQLCFYTEKFDQAMNYFLQLSAQKDLEAVIKRRCSDNLLSVAICFSEKEIWAKSFSCLAAAKFIYAENPTLRYITKNMEADLKTLTSQSGDYNTAIESLENELKNKGFLPEKVHLLASTCLTLSEESSVLSIFDKIILLEKSHICWTALSFEKDYWSSISDKKTQMTNDNIPEITPSLGALRCVELLNKIQAEVEEKNDNGILQVLANKQKEMSLERHSAKLLNEISLPGSFKLSSGGFMMQALLPDHKEFEKNIAKINSDKIGSPEWLFKGITDEKYYAYVTHYLKGDDVSYPKSTNNKEDEYLGNLSGLALKRRAEIALKGQDVRSCDKECHEIAGRVLDIPNPSIQNQVGNLLDEMVLMQIQGCINQKQEDKAIKFVMGILEKVETKGKNKLLNARNKLGELFLKSGEEKCANGDLDGFLKDYSNSVRYSKDKNICENKFKSIVNHHLKQLNNKNEFKASLSFIENLQSKHPYSMMPFLRSQYSFTKALQKLNGAFNLSDQTVIELLKDAYEADKKHKEIAIAELYSQVLSSKAANIVKNASNVTLSILSSSEDLLRKAIDVYPENKQARKHLKGVLEHKTTL